MNPSFNLIHEPWIPVVRLDGTTTTLSIKDTFMQAHELSEILDNSPLVTISLYRFCLSILHYVYMGPTSYKQWYEIFNQKRIDEEKYNQFIEQYQTSFDLFDDDNPFYQCLDKEVLESGSHPPSKLAHELAAGNNDTLFDHSNIYTSNAWSFEQAVRYLIAYQNFAVGGGVSKPFNLCHSPIIRGCLILIKGENLFQTFMFNLMRMEEWDKDSSDQTSWAVRELTKPKKRISKGHLDLLTLQPRRIKLNTSDQSKVVSIQMLQGVAIENEILSDVMHTFTYRKNSEGYLTLKFDENRSLWRDVTALIAEFKEQSKPSATMWQLRSLLYKFNDLKDIRISIDVLGIKPDNKKAAKMNLWRHERFPLPISYIFDNELIFNLDKAIKDSETIGSVIRTTIYHLAENIILPQYDNNNEKKKPKPDEVKKVFEKFTTLQHYWSSLEPHFSDLYLSIPNDAKAANDKWSATIKDIAEKSLEETLRGLDRSARSLQAAVRARSELHFQLNKLIPKKDKEVA